LLHKAKFTRKKDYFTQSLKTGKKLTTKIVFCAKWELLGIPRLLGLVLLLV